MGRPVRVLLVAGLVGSLVACAVGAGAVGPGSPRGPLVLLGPNIRVSGPDAIGDWSPQLAVAWNSSAGEYLIVWSDQRDVASQGSEIYARRVDGDGTPLGDDIHLTGAGGVSNQHQPAVAWNATLNEYLVVWSDWRTCATGGPGSNIWGRRVGADGTLIGRNLRISGGPANEVDPAVVWNASANEYLVVWEDDRGAVWEGAPQPADGWQVYGRRLNGDATRIGGWIRISGPTGIPQCADPLTDCMPDPQVVWNATANEYLVVWQDGRDVAARGRDILARRVGTDGTRLGGNFRVSGRAATGDEGGPAVVWSETANEYLVAWHDGRNPARGADIYARRLALDGTRLGREVRVSGPLAVGDEQFPTVAWNGAADEYLVVWQDERDWISARWEVFGRLLTAGGLPTGDDLRINTTPSGDQLRAAAVYNATANQYMVAWRDDRHGAAYGAVYGQLIAG